MRRTSPRYRPDPITRFRRPTARRSSRLPAAGVFAACTLAVVALAGTGCRRASPDAGGSSAPSGDLVVHRGTFRGRALLTGELRAERAAKIDAPATEEWQLVIKWLEKDGTPVKAGQRVVEFDSSTLLAGLEEKRLAVISALREEEQEEARGAADVADKGLALEKARMALEKAEIDAAVPEELVSRRDFQDLQLKLEKARVEVVKAEDQLEAARKADRASLAVRRIAREGAQREARTAEDAIDRLTVTAPRDGIFQMAEHPWEGRTFQTGDSVFPGFALAFIPEPASLMVEASLVDVDDRSIGVGMPVACTLDAYPERGYAGKVVGISPVAQEPSRGSRRRAFRVSVTLDSVDEARMRVGMSVKVEVETAREPDVLLAPRAALDPGGALARARLANGRLVKVALGPCSAQDCVVVGGLTEGTRLEMFRKETP